MKKQPNATRKLLLLPAAVSILGLALTGCVSVADRDDDKPASKPGVEVKGDNSQKATVEGDKAAPSVQAPTVDAGEPTDAAGQGASGEFSDESTQHTVEDSSSAGSDQSTQGRADSGLASLPLEPGWQPQPTSRLDCSGGAVDIAASEAVVELTASCPKVSITGTDTVVLAPHGIGHLDITGADNDVATTALESLTLVGSDNTIAYEGAKPKINNTGADNEVGTQPLED